MENFLKSIFMVILFCELLTSILIKKLGIPKKLVMLEFEGIRIPNLFKMILGIKSSIEMWWSQKDSINLVELKTPLKW